MQYLAAFYEYMWALAKTRVPGAFLSQNGCAESVLAISDWPAPVCGQTLPGAPDPFYFAQLPHVFGQLIFPSSGLLEQTRPSTDYNNNKIDRPCDG